MYCGAHRWAPLSSFCKVAYLFSPTSKPKLTLRAARFLVPGLVVNTRTSRRHSCVARASVVRSPSLCIFTQHHGVQVLGAQAPPHGWQPRLQVSGSRRTHTKNKFAARLFFSAGSKSVVFHRTPEGIPRRRRDNSNTIPTPPPPPPPPPPSDPPHRCGAERHNRHTPTQNFKTTRDHSIPIFQLTHAQTQHALPTGRRRRPRRTTRSTSRRRTTASARGTTRTWWDGSPR